jgi:hypothetical protein
MVSKEPDDGLPYRLGAQVDVMIDRGRQVGAGEQPALLAHLDRDRACADTVQYLPRQPVRHHAERCGIEHQRSRVRRRDAIVEPVHAEVRDRRHIDHQQRDQHQRNGQQQQLAGQTELGRSHGPLFHLQLVVTC